MLSIGMLVAGAGRAMAAPESDDAAFATPFDSLQVKDSHGINVWRYVLSIDGGSATNPNAVVFSPLVQIVWGSMRLFASLSIWFVGWVLRFDWLDLLLAPVAAIGEASSVMVDRLGVVGVFAMAAALFAGFMMFRGRHTTFVYDLMMAAVLAALATGAMHDPVEKIGGENGYVIKARDAGMEFAAGLSNGGDTSGNVESNIEQLQTEMADTLLRQPTQMINFGRVIDADEQGGQACIDEWDKGHQNVEGNDVDTVKDNVAKCGEAGEEMKAWADNPGVNMLFVAVTFAFSQSVINLLFLLFGILVMVAVGLALYSSVMLIWTIVIGILPGETRGMLWNNVATLLVSLVLVTVSIAFLAGYLQFIQAVFAATEGTDLLMRMVMIDALYLLGLVLFVRLWFNVKKRKDGLAARLAKRPGAEPTALPAKTATSLPKLASKTMLTKAAIGAMSGGAGTAAAVAGNHAARRLTNPGTSRFVPSSRTGEGSRSEASPQALPGGSAPTPAENVRVDGQGPVQVNGRSSAGELPPGSARGSDGPEPTGAAPAPRPMPSSPGGGSAVSPLERPGPGPSSGVPRSGPADVVDGQVLSSRASTSADRGPVYTPEPLPNQERRAQHRAGSTSRGVRVGGVHPAPIPTGAGESGSGARQRRARRPRVPSSSAGARRPGATVLTRTSRR
ncbi:hypothetical protein [Dietzia cercidiphylli]|uniref:hypothetical protein n=1 Tax=Dietzia cercidiphylli TaxID=498199 RepID=UPI00223B51A1|nr:hypothetical protein [Dietzia cercidiphylli]MCT1515312.1 hypothetical protein [Dietzia cercidiphylli]